MRRIGEAALILLVIVPLMLLGIVAGFVWGCLKEGFDDGCRTHALLKKSADGM